MAQRVVASAVARSVGLSPDEVAPRLADGRTVTNIAYAQGVDGVRVANVARRAFTAMLTVDQHGRARAVFLDVRNRRQR